MLEKLSIQNRILQNRILQNLPLTEWTMLDPFLEPVTLKQSEQLIQFHTSAPDIFFIESGFASVCGAAAENRTVNIGLIGREGVVGATVFLGVHCTPHDCFMQIEGSAHRISSEKLLSICKNAPVLTASILQFVHILLVQSAETAISNRIAAIESRLARSLLMCHDRLDSDEFCITHEVLARMLGVRRATVTVALHVLEGEKILKSLRGRVVITDRLKLEEAAHGCYGAAEAEYRRIFAQPDEQGQMPKSDQVRSYA